ncbi:MAG: MSCRAMM family protein [Oscillospiraceae bacterium]|jgi:LPXTG-motif cell wall-anchored protein
MKGKGCVISKKLVVFLVSLMMLIAMLPTTAFAGYNGDRRPGGGGSTEFDHLDIKLDSSLAYLNQNDEQRTVKFTWNKQNMVNYMEVYIGEGSTTNVVPSSTSDPAWGWGGGNDETRLDVSAKKTDPVRVVVKIPVEALGLEEWEVSSLYDTNEQGKKVLEFENVYHWDDEISGVSNICPNKSGLDVKIKSEAIIDYAKYGTIEIKKVVENADGSTSSDKNTSFSFRITSADGSFSETFTLKNGESKKYESLPVGTYYIDELNVPSGYTVEGYNREVVLKEANEYKALTVTNVKKDTNKGTLTVGKILNENKEAVNLPKDASFTFTVTGNGVNASFTLTKADILLGKDSYTFANLTPGSYTVTETAAYANGSMIKTTTASVKVGSGQETNVDLENDGLAASVRKGETTSVWFTNAYDAKPQTFPVIVNYYKDSVGSANYLGTTSLGEYEANTSITLNAEQLDAKKPAEGYLSGVQQGSVPYIVVSSSRNVIDVLYVAETFPVTVNYYKDSVTNPDDGNFLGSQTLGNYENNDAITLNSEQLNAYKPAAGYVDGVQQGSVPYIVVKGENNVINVLYETEKFDVIVNYYKDVVTTPEDDNYLGTKNLGEFEADDTITLNGEQLNAYKPATGYVDGVQQGAIPYVVVSSDDNVINVLYVTEKFDVIVNYYKDAVTTPEDDNYLGTKNLGEFEADDTITLNGEQLNAYKPATGYVDGVQQGVIPYVVVSAEDNVINVLYIEETFPVTVNYYKDSVAEGNLLGSASFTDEFTAGSEITLAAGAESTQLDFLKPDGYVSGVQQDAVPYVVVSSENNVIDVLYVEETFPVTVNYYKDSVAEGNLLGSASFTDEFTAGSEITLAAGAESTQLDFLKPDGYVSGVQIGSIPYVVTKGEGNVINVLYVAETYTVTVNYYKDSITNPNDANNFLGSATFETPFEAGDAITLLAGTDGTQLNFLKPVLGYADGVQAGSVPYIVVKDGENVINVLYTVVEEELPDEEPPLVGPDDPDEEIPDEEPPLVGPSEPTENDEVIEDEEVPLAAPKTGDSSNAALLAAIMLASAAGGIFLRKKFSK